MAKRKTFSVSALLKESNRILALESLSNAEKQGICHVLEHVLHSTDNYKGYNQTYWLRQGCKEWKAAGATESKTQYIYGPKGKEEGEFSRFYYS